MYFLSVIELDSSGKLMDSDCVGYFSSEEGAIEALCENRADMFEDRFNYAVIEEIEPDMVYPDALERTFFRYIPALDGYRETEEPEGLKHWTNFAII